MQRIYWKGTCGAHLIFRTQPSLFLEVGCVLKDSGEIAGRHGKYYVCDAAVPLVTQACHALSCISTVQYLQVQSLSISLVMRHGTLPCVWSGLRLRVDNIGHDKLVDLLLLLLGFGSLLLLLLLLKQHHMVGNHLWRYVGGHGRS